MALYDDFTTILSDFLHKKESSVDSSIEEDIYTYARKHSLSGIIRFQLLGKQESQEFCLKMCINYLKRQSLEKELKRIFDEAGIKYFFVKGTAVAEYYPVAALRSMSDSDIVVEDREKVRPLLEENGYQIREDSTSDWHFIKDGVHFELHSKLLYGNLLNPQKHLEFFDRCWDYVKDNTLDWNFHFLFLIEHLRKHLVWEGVGFRQFMDLAVMIQYASDLFDWQWIRKQLEELDMDGFTDVCFSLIERWFDVEPPYSVPKASDEVYEFASSKILENGVFGFSGEKYKNETEREIYITESKDDSYIFTLIKRFKGRLFPGYDELVAWPQYAFIKNRRYLLPICWIYRLIRGIFHPEKVSKNVKWSNMSKDQYQKYNDELKKWGL